MESPHIGILLNSSMFRQIPSGKTKHEKIEFYEEAGQQHQVTLCYFRLRDVDFKHKQVLAWIKINNRYTQRKIPIPRVIHNRGMYFKRTSFQKISQLIQQGHIVFNRHTRYTKLQIHRLLLKHADLHPHLPETSLLTHASLRQFLAKYGSVIIKPNSGSIGIGISKIERRGRKWWITHTSKRPRRKAIRGKLYSTPQVYRLFARRIRSHKFVVQQTLPLALYQGRPFDLRVSVQRDATGKWIMTGLVGKAAAKEKFVTNVAQGGTVYALEELLRDLPELKESEVRERIQAFSLKIAECLSTHLPGLADIGLDIGINAQGLPLFIECNGRDLRYSFLKGNMMEEWKATYANPIAYSRYLVDTLSSEKPSS
ncbi:YheC/YheD family endospore coat-associated protein [Marinicrinis sediminis]|uniref:YheC/YheD family protein n=1 Tax=Marinicrinis sediminis TaxID=1652465 RepID=A0ABW5R7P6_9BACL